MDISNYLTPFKLQKPVIKGSGIPGNFDSVGVDCPFVFFHNNQFHMLYVGFDGKGYQTALAVSDDLLSWQTKGVILKREESSGRWDSVGAAGSWILKSSNDINELPVPKKVDGKYWMIYHSYPGSGYESGPAQMGLAWTEDESLMSWNRLNEPILICDKNAEWESAGLYKACLIEHEETYYMFYNAKNREEGWLEQTGGASSKNMVDWERFSGNPILKVRENMWDSKFASDPAVYKDRNKWLMFYFGYNHRHAQEGLAFSDDLHNWTAHPEPIVRAGNPGELDAIHAHKPSIIKHNGTLYHFYCASRRYEAGDPTNMEGEFRCITVAASKPF